jgi:hypothetical protein
MTPSSTNLEMALSTAAREPNDKKLPVEKGSPFLSFEILLLMCSETDIRFTN